MTRGRDPCRSGTVRLTHRPPDHSDVEFPVSSPLPLKSYRFARPVISFAVWAHYRFAMSLRDVEDLLAARGVLISHETIRAWVNRL
jgi:hypothetical protein